MSSEKKEYNISFEENDQDQELLQGNFVPLPSWDVSPSQWESLKVLDDMQADIFKTAYMQASSSHDSMRQLHVLEEIYKAKEHIELVPYLIQMALQVRQYSKAMDYVGIRQASWASSASLPPELVLSLLFNTLDISFKDIDRIKKTVLEYAKSWDFSADQVSLYSALITYARWDIDNFSFFMDQLKETDASSWYASFQRNKQLSDSYKDVPTTYLDALIAKQILHAWYYKVALVWARRVMRDDSDYILPRQVAWYASLFLGEWEDVIGYMEWLQKKDTDHEQLYTFLKWVAQYNLWQYAQAILSFRDVRVGELQWDAERYLLLSYDATKDIDNTHDVLQTLFERNDLSVYDYWTIFTIFFYDPLRSEEEVVLFAKYFETANAFIDTCYQRLWKEHAYVCLWWKTGLLLVNGQYDKAYRYLERLVQWYPQSFLYETLWDIAYYQDDISSSKQWFIKALQTTHEDELRNWLLRKVKNLLLQEW